MGANITNETPSQSAESASCVFPEDIRFVFTWALLSRRAHTGGLMELDDAPGSHQLTDTATTLAEVAQAGLRAGS